MVGVKAAAERPSDRRIELALLDKLVKLAIMTSRILEGYDVHVNF
jgi:hypothetical protein